jgi:PAS domain S-box-containing protein
MSAATAGHGSAQGKAAESLTEFDFLAGGGELGELIRQRDWAASPLGPLESWPQGLRTAVGIMLSSRYAMFIWWGPQMINFYNDAYRPFLGKKHPHALGRPARHAWADIWEQVGPRATAVLERAESTFDEDLLLITDRFDYAEETYFTFSYSPIRDVGGAVGGIFCAVTEDTRRVIGERRMRLLREVAAKAPDTHTPEEVCRTAANCIGDSCRDLPFVLLYLNEPDGHTARLAAQVNLPPDAIVSPQSIDLTSEASAWPLRQVVRESNSLVVERAHGLPDSLPFGPWDRSPVRAVIVPLREHAQAPVAGFLVAGLNPYLPFDEDYRGFIGLLGDQIAAGIARAHSYQLERRRAEALAQIDRAKTAFFSNVSHEFRTPLTLILGPMEEAAMNAKVPPAVRAQLEIAHRNSLRLLKLVNTLLDFSRIEADRMQASYVPTDLGAVTRDLASTFRSAIEGAGLEFNVDCQPLEQPVHVDREMWEKVVLNLLSNAFKYTLAGSIKMCVYREGDQAVLDVVDTGVGIPQDELPRLFERFHRVEGVVGRTQEGSGIGLALVQELVRLHGGTISVASQINRGTTFRVRVPFGVAHLPSDRIKSEHSKTGVAGAQAYVQEALRWMPSSGESTSTRLPLAEGPPSVESGHFARTFGARVLLADDNADMRDYVRDLLSSTYVVETVADGVQALTAARRAPPDLVLSDIMMPHLNGIGLLKALREDPQLRDIPVILLSARAGEEARIEGMETGADDYLVKPFSARELSARVGAHLALRRAHREALTSLRESEQRTRNLFQQAPGFVCVLTGPEHVFEFANDSYQRFVGNRLLLGKTVREAFPELQGQSFFELLDQVYRTGEAITRSETPLQLQRVPGAPLERLFIDFIYQPVKDAAGSVNGIFVEGFDVTERVGAQRALRRSEELRQLALDAARMGTFTWYPAEDRSDSDERMLALFGLPPRSDLSLASALATLIHAADRAHYAAAVAHAIDPAGDGILQAEIRVHRADDRSVRWLSILGQAFFEGEPRHAVYMAGTAADITERKRAEHALQERSAQFRTLLDQAPLGVYLVDSALRIREANPTASALFGHTSLTGRYLDELLREFWPARAEEVIARFRHALETGESYEAPEDRSVRGQPAVLEYFEWRIHRIPLMDGQPGVVCYFRDISAQVRVRLALEKADQQKDEFLAMLAHELRNPLAPIDTASQLLARMPGQDSRREASIAVIRRQVRHLTRLVDDLLDVSRITRGRIGLQRDFVDLSAVVAQAVEMVQPQLREKQHQLSVTTTGAMPVYTAGDFARLVQCVGNLLANAIKYTEAGGQIAVHTYSQNKHMATVEVTDNGVGITSELLPSVFDLFVQSDRTLDRAQGGLGIGLAVVKRLVEMQGGSVTARSAGEGLGSTFSIQLPRVERQLNATVEAAMPPAAPRRVLVVDDNEDAAETLAALLRIEGHEVQAVYNGRKALERVDNFVPHVVLLDIGLPEMNGYELAQCLRRLPQLSEVHLVALSGYGQAEDRQRSQAAGFDDHLVKPVDPSALRRVLATAAATVP